METYQKEYKEFVGEFKERPVSGLEVGEVIAMMAHYFSEYNLEMIEALRDFNEVKKEAEGQIDAAGKAISSTKAGVIADASPEAHKYQKARAHLQNIEQIINALKAMQKGVLNEYAHSNLAS